MEKLRAFFHRLIKGMAKEGQPMKCASCGRQVVDPEQAIVLEPGETGEYRVTCCELCSKREWRKQETACG